MTNSTFYDIQANSKAALAEWNVGVGTGKPFNVDDFEVQGAINAANAALLGLIDAVERAQARYQIDISRKQIEQAERVLRTVAEHPGTPVEASQQETTK